MNKHLQETEMENNMQLSEKAKIIRNIGALSLGDRAYCGQFGTVTCTKKASAWAPNAKVPRKFSVSGSKKLVNRGNYTMKQLRKAITEA